MHEYPLHYIPKQRAGGERNPIDNLEDQLIEPSYGDDIEQAAFEAPWYTRFPIQPLEFIEQNKLGYHEANVIKYITRHPHKGGAKDILEAMFYLLRILKAQYGLDYSLPQRQEK